MITYEKILNELSQIEANADAVKSQCFTLRKQLEQVAKPGTSKSKKLQEAITKAAAHRRKIMFKQL